MKKSEAGPQRKAAFSPEYGEKRVKLRIRNGRQDVSYYYTDPDGVWKKIGRSHDISGFHHNVFGRFIFVRPGIYAAGSGTTRFAHFRYRSLD